MEIDLTAPDYTLTPGVDLWEVKEAELEPSQAGQKMLKLIFFRVSTPGELLYDRIMLEGGGWPIGKRKLQAIYGDTFKGSIDTLALRGKRMWIETSIANYKGQDRLQVNIEGLKYKGYQPENDPPPGMSAPVASEGGSDDVPF